MVTAQGDPVPGRQPSAAVSDVPVAAAYVVSRYPLTSHAFIQREVHALRRLGVRIETFSIRRTDAADVLSNADRDEQARTSALVPIGALRLIAIHLFAALRGPRAYVVTLRAAIGGTRGQARVWQLFYFAEAIVLWHRCDRRKLRHLHAHLANVAADVALLAARFGRTRRPDEGWWWSFTMHGPTEFFDVEGFHLPFKVREADLVVCISDFCRSQLMAFTDADHWDKFRVVHCGADLQRFRPSPAAIPPGDRRERPLDLLCVGRLVPEKGQSLLLDAIALLRDRGVAVCLTIAGAGPDRATLEARADRLGVCESVRFLGAVNQDIMPEVLRDAQVFCLPSFAEGVPVVLMEAMATGLPVVTTVIAGIPELVTDQVNGLLVAPGRADLLADAVAQLTDGELRARMGQEGRRTVALAFDSQRCAGDLASLFAAGPESLTM